MSPCQNTGISFLHWRVQLIRNGSPHVAWDASNTNLRNSPLARIVNGYPMVWELYSLSQ